MKTKIALPAWLPDQSSNSGGLNEATNVYPRTDGYGPINTLAGASAALPAAFKGGMSFIAGDGTSSLLVGTAAGLVAYASGAWNALASGMTVTGHWRFVQFGNYAVCVNGALTKVVNLSTVVATTLAGAPTGVCIAVVGDYVVIGQNSGDLLGIYTSGFNNHTDWNPAGTGGATIQPMLTGGEVMGLAGGEYGVILQRQRLVRMTRTGDNTAPFQYDEITPNVGCASKASVVQVGRTVFFLSDRGFMALEDGQQIRPLGSEKVDRTFQAAVLRDDYERMFAAVDPQNKLVMWCVPGSPGSLWIYNFELDRWSYGRLPIDGVFSGFTASLTLEAVAALYPDIDAMAYSLDDPRFSGGNPRLYGVQAGALGTFTGATLDCAFEFSFNEFSAGRVTRFTAFRPVGDAIAGQGFTVDCRARLGDAANVTTAGALRDNGVLPVRASGRYAKARWTIAAGAAWTYAQAVEVEYQAGGER